MRNLLKILEGEEFRGMITTLRLAAELYNHRSILDGELNKSNVYAEDPQAAIDAVNLFVSKQKELEPRPQDLGKGKKVYDFLHGDYVLKMNVQGHDIPSISINLMATEDDLPLLFIGNQKSQ